MKIEFEKGNIRSYTSDRKYLEESIKIVTSKPELWRNWLQESTIGAAFLTQTLSVNDTTIKFEIWDTAGQERYHSLAPMYYRGAAAAIIVYDITNPVSTFHLLLSLCRNVE